MPSNRTWVCVPCRLAFKQTAKCPACKGPMVETYKWSPPKRNNDRAWKRIAAGEWLWDRRRVRRHNWGWAETSAVGRDKRKHGTSWTATWSPRTKDGARVDMGA